MGERNHHRHAAIGEAEEVEALGVGSKRPGTNILYRANTVVGVYHFFADLKRHAQTLVHSFGVGTSSSFNLKENSKLKVP